MDPLHTFHLNVSSSTCEVSACFGVILVRPSVIGRPARARCWLGLHAALVPFLTFTSETGGRRDVTAADGKPTHERAGGDVKSLLGFLLVCVTLVVFRQPCGPKPPGGPHGGIHPAAVCFGHRRRVVMWAHARMEDVLTHASRRLTSSTWTPVCIC